MTYSAEQLSDLQLIQDCALRYCRGVDRLDVDLMKSAYWPDATDDHGVFVGNAMEFADMCMQAHLKWRSTNHCIMNHTIELDEDAIHARGEIYNVTYLFQDTADVLDTWHGRYLDLYQKRDGEWRIQERVCVHEGTHSEQVTSMNIAADTFRQTPPGPSIPRRSSALRRSRLRWCRRRR